MNRNWNWQGWLAIALAGLALLVALGGRGPWGAERAVMVWSESAAAPAAPAAPQAQVAPAAPAAPFARGFGRGHGDFRDGPMARADMMALHGRPGHHGLFGLFGLIGALTKLIALGLLAWLLLRLFTQRRNTPPAAPAQTTPAGHDPTVE